MRSDNREPNVLWRACAWATCSLAAAAGGVVTLGRPTEGVDLRSLEPTVPTSSRVEGWTSRADPAICRDRSETVGFEVVLWAEGLRSFIRRTSEPRLVGEPVGAPSERTGLVASGDRVSPPEGLVVLCGCRDPIRGEMRRTREPSDVASGAERVESWPGIEPALSDEPGETVPEPIRPPMLLVASEPMLPLRAEGEDRSTYDLRLGELVAPLMGLSLCEGVE